MKDKAKLKIFAILICACLCMSACGKRGKENVSATIGGVISGVHTVASYIGNALGFRTSLTRRSEARKFDRQFARKMEVLNAEKGKETRK